ncbi:MAG: preprotein translocase subunit SecG [Rickettsiales bacterium]
MITVLFIVQLILAVTLVISVLLQRSDQDGFGLGSSSGGMGLLSGRSKANLLTRTTAIIATLFMLNSILLTVLSMHGTEDSFASQVEGFVNPDAKKVEPEAPAPVVPREGESLKKDTPAETQTENTEPVTPETTSPNVSEPEQPAPEQSTPVTPEPTEVPKAK